MKKRITTWLAGALIFIILSSCTPQTTSTESASKNDEKDKKKKPEGPLNILVIMTDQQRFDQLGYSSNDYFETPNLDKLAESGVIFDNAYSCAAVCIPSRGSLLTGLQPHRYETHGLWSTLKEGFWTTPHELRENGYQTALIGKMHFHPMRSDHGFEHMRLAEHLGMVYGPNETDDYTDWLETEGKNDWRATHKFGPEQQKEKLEYQLNLQAIPFYYDQYYHPTNWIAREAVDFLENRDTTKPYFLITSFPHPHQPYDPPAPYDTMYDIEDAVLPEVAPDINSQLPPDALALMQKNGFGYAHTNKIDIDLQKKINTYIRALIKQIDDAVGEIIKHVDLNNTVVVFTTDHGDYYGHRGLMLKTPGIPFDDIAKVPFFVSGAGIPEGKRVSNVIQSSDLALTCLELACVEPPSPEVFDTQSLVPFFEDNDPPDERTAYCASNVGWPMIRYKDYKYFYNEPTGQEILFDVLKDPSESINLVNDSEYASILNDMREKMKAELAKGIPELPRYEKK